MSDNYAKCIQCNWRPQATNNRTGKLYEHGLCTSCWKMTQSECVECPKLRKGLKINLHDHIYPYCYECSEILKTLKEVNSNND